MTLASRLIRAAALVLLSAPLLALPAATEESVFGPEQEQAIQEIVRDYLLENPEVLVEALEFYRAKQQQLAEQRKREAVIAQRAALEQDPDAPVLGNPDGDVVIVEFFDYRCPYCKRTAELVRDVVREDGNIRLVMKEYPILGPESLYAAQVALAARGQGKYEEFHFALMGAPGNLDQAAVMHLAQAVGLDIEQLKRDMRAAEVDRAIRKNYELAEALEITGTPAFVVGRTIVPGAIDRESLIELVARERAG